MYFVVETLVLLGPAIFIHTLLYAYNKKHTMRLIDLRSPRTWKKLFTRPPKTFTKFSQLPIELRLKIWRMSQTEPRVVEIKYDTAIKSFSINSIIPTILRVCSESRAEGLKIFQVFKFNLNVSTPLTSEKDETSKGQQTIVQSPFEAYMNYETDILYLRNSSNRKPNWFTYMDSSPSFAKVQHIAFGHDLMKSHTGNMRVDARFGVAFQLKRCIRKHNTRIKTLSLVYNDSQPGVHALRNDAVVGGRESAVEAFAPLDPRVWYLFDGNRPLDFANYKGFDHLVRSVRALLKKEEPAAKGMRPVLRSIEILPVVAVRKGKKLKLKDAWYDTVSTPRWLEP